jgi:hypothetical protein
LVVVLGVVVLGVVVLGVFVLGVLAGVEVPGETPPVALEEL